MPAAPVLIGTEAVLHRVRRAAAVVFLDIDLHLLAPRLSAAEETLALFVRAGPARRRPGGGPALGPHAGPDTGARAPAAAGAWRSGSPTEVLAEEVAIRRASALPPFSALAVVSGALGPAYAEALGQQAAATLTSWTSAAGPVSVSPLGDDRFLLRRRDP